MLTTTERMRKRTRCVEREAARQRMREQIADEAAGTVPEETPWWSELARQLPQTVAVDEPRQPAAAARTPQLVGLDGQPLSTETRANLVRPDGQPLSGQRAVHEDFHEEDEDVLELLHEEFLDGVGPGEGHGQGEDGDSCESARRLSLEVADIFHRFGPEYRRLYGNRLSVPQDRVLRELMVCRTR